MKSDIKFIGKFLTILLCASAFALISCDKNDEEEETKPYLIGELYYELPAYALVGTSLDLYGGGVVDPDNVKYFWTSANLLPADTVFGSTCRITVPDSLGDFALTLTAEADGYYNKTATKYVTSIKLGNGGTMTGLVQANDSIQDPRDGTWYRVTEVGNLIWFGENLNWAGKGQCYAKADAIGLVLGRLYTWNDATGGETGSGLGSGPQGVCPEGWSIPTAEDWEDLAKAISNGEEFSFYENWQGLGDNVMVDAKFNGRKLWPYSPECTPLNMFRWAALSAGSCTNDYNNYSGLASYAFWWSAAEKDSNNAYYRYIYSNLPDFNYNYTNKAGMGASVRCVKLKENN